MGDGFAFLTILLRSEIEQDLRGRMQCCKVGSSCVVPRGVAEEGCILKPERMIVCAAVGVFTGAWWEKESEHGAVSNRAR
jgi:hypothetical protein